MKHTISKGYHINSWEFGTTFTILHFLSIYLNSSSSFQCSQKHSDLLFALAGNELSGKGVGANVDAVQYGKDVTKLNSIINELYKNIHPRPRVIAPGGFYDKAWYAKFLEASGPHVVDIVTHHVYNLGAGKLVFQELQITCYIGVSQHSSVIGIWN